MMVDIDLALAQVRDILQFDCVERLKVSVRGRKMLLQFEDPLNLIVTSHQEELDIVTVVV